MKLTTNPKVEAVFNNYPAPFRKKMITLRQLILDTATETEGVDELEETLKWGEPSYLAKKGSTVRIHWKKSKPEHYAVYFKCTSKLVSTFREVYGDTFSYENNRAILFKLDDEIPIAELKHCVQMALTYHRVKHLPFLGA